MPYSITLRSKTDATITGWYDGSSSRWSTDHTRQKLFDNKHEAKSVRDELRSLCPRNAKVISIEPERRPHSQRDITSSLNFGSEFARDSPQEGDDFELAAPPNKTITQTRQSPIRWSGYPPRLNPSRASTARLTHHDDEWK